MLSPTIFREMAFIQLDTCSLAPKIHCKHGCSRGGSISHVGCLPWRAKEAMVVKDNLAGQAQKTTVLSPIHRRWYVLNNKVIRNI